MLFLCKVVSYANDRWQAISTMNPLPSSSSSICHKDMKMLNSNYLDKKIILDDSKSLSPIWVCL